MKLSLEWLGQYVDLADLSPKDIAYKLTMSTAEVEDVEILKRAVKGIIAGEIIEIEPIDTGDSGKLMQYVTVNTGAETFKTVCGAPNVKPGMKSAFAAPGAVIADNFLVQEQKVFGLMSRGILCSPKELGWGESHAGIIAFPDSLPKGTELASLVPEYDHVIEIDNKSITHRPDLWGHYGFAREMAAIYGRSLKPLELIDASEGNDLPPFPLRIDDREGCPGYCCLEIDGLSPAFSPVEMQYRLLAVGLRPINLLVDLTNYLMCELGQPMHSFDGERVRDIIVAPFGKIGAYQTLDSVERKMIPEDLMICDHDGPIALAGIMGGEDSEVKEGTSRVLLESANFNPARIRRTMIRLGLRTDAGVRFEKGQPPYHMALSIRRFVHLLREAGQKARLRSQLTCGGDTGEKGRLLSMDKSDLTRSIGMAIPDGRVRKILVSLGFECTINDKEILLVIPPHRSARDISIPRDIVEEVARIYGYDNIVPSMPDMKMRSGTFNTELQKQHKIRRFLSQAKGFSEVHTYSWYDDIWLKRMAYNPGETLTLVNPAAENNTRMRRELIPNLLELVEMNAVHRDTISFYEIGNVFHPALRQAQSPLNSELVEESNGFRQAMHLGGVVYQTEKIGNLQELFLRVKGTVEEICAFTNAGIPEFTASHSSAGSEPTDRALSLSNRALSLSNQALSLSNRALSLSKSAKPWTVPGSYLNIHIGDSSAGQIGYLTGNLLNLYEHLTQIVWFELLVDVLAGPTFPDVLYSEIPVYPGSWMDFSVLADKNLSYAVLGESIRKFTHPILRKVKYLYLFSGNIKGGEKGLPEGEKKISYTFRFWLGLKDRTLTGDDLSQFREFFLRYLEENGLALR
ncbi:MAG: phenylalanine--tRNA ligase subunit beta [Candidatus Latescibacter sp.]|nr:phenylalanine--tRNA ligase subunit beta [Candidatus Latescibacter sp.]